MLMYVISIDRYELNLEISDTSGTPYCTGTVPYGIVRYGTVNPYPIL